MKLEEPQEGPGDRIVLQATDASGMTELYVDGLGLKFVLS